MSDVGHTGDPVPALIRQALTDGGVTDPSDELVASLVVVANPQARGAAAAAAVAQLTALLAEARQYVQVVSSDPTLFYPSAQDLLDAIDVAVPPSG